jgi:hypothetical protein
VSWLIGEENRVAGDIDFMERCLDEMIGERVRDKNIE